MSGHLFAVKTMSLVIALRGLKDKIEANNHHCRGTPVGPVDNKIRMVLSSPEVQIAVYRMLKVKDCRVLFAFDAQEPKFGLDRGYLEIYSLDGTPLVEPIEAPQIEENLSNAIQVELFHFLLKQYGVVDIPMM